MTVRDETVSDERLTKFTDNPTHYASEIVSMARELQFRRSVPSEPVALQQAANKVRSVCNRFADAAATYPDIEQWYVSSAYSIIAAYRQYSVALPSPASKPEVTVAGWLQMDGGNPGLIGNDEGLAKLDRGQPYALIAMPVSKIGDFP